MAGSFLKKTWPNRGKASKRLCWSRGVARPSPTDKHSKLISEQTPALQTSLKGHRKQLPESDVCLNAYFPGRRPISNPRALTSLLFCKTAALFLFVTNTDIISTGSDMGVYVAGSLPVAWLFTTKLIFSLNTQTI